jgi:hypothetical protein
MTKRKAKPDLSGRNIESGGRRIGAVERGNIFVPCVANLTDEDAALLVKLGLMEKIEKPGDSTPVEELEENGGRSDSIRE